MAITPKASLVWRNSWLAGATLLLLLAVYLLYSNLGNYNASYDSGVYLESARMMGRGFGLYRQIFDSQPPLWLLLIYVSFRMFGETAMAGQLVTATAGLITILAVMQMTSRLGGKGGAILAGVLVTLSPLELQWSRSLNGDVPAVALASISMAFAAGYARHGRRTWLMAAALASMGAIMIKLSGVYAVPALLLFVIARWKKAEALDRWQLVPFVALDTFIVIGIFGGITLFSLAWFRPDQLWHQVVTFHWAARSVHGSITLDDKWHTLFDLAAGERLLIGATPLTVLCLLSGIEGLALLAWPCFTFFGLLEHHPLYDHHLVALIPALAAAIGVGASNLRIVYPPLVRRLSIQPRPARMVALTACAIVGLAILGGGASQAWIEAANQHALMRLSVLPSSEGRLVNLIVSQTLPDEMIVTDDQGLAFLADRDMPPGLTDTSYTRITSGYLRSHEVIEQAEQYHVRFVLLWTGRLASMPEVVHWANERFPFRTDLGNGRVLYTRE